MNSDSPVALFLEKLATLAEQLEARDAIAAQATQETLTVLQNQGLRLLGEDLKHAEQLHARCMEAAARFTESLDVSVNQSGASRRAIHAYTDAEKAR